MVQAVLQALHELVSVSTYSPASQLVVQTFPFNTPSAHLLQVSALEHSAQFSEHLVHTPDLAKYPEVQVATQEFSNKLKLDLQVEHPFLSPEVHLAHEV